MHLYNKYNKYNTYIIYSIIYSIYSKNSIYYIICNEINNISLSQEGEEEKHSQTGGHSSLFIASLANTVSVGGLASWARCCACCVVQHIPRRTLDAVVRSRPIAVGAPIVASQALEASRVGVLVGGTHISALIVL
jgi:hypothetical protein